jgi:hypothetical protein
MRDIGLDILRSITKDGYFAAPYAYVARFTGVAATHLDRLGSPSAENHSNGYERTTRMSGSGGRAPGAY